MNTHALSRQMCKRTRRIHTVSLARFELIDPSGSAAFVLSGLALVGFAMAFHECGVFLDALDRIRALGLEIAKLVVHRQDTRELMVEVMFWDRTGRSSVLFAAIYAWIGGLAVVVSDVRARQLRSLLQLLLRGMKPSAW